MPTIKAGECLDCGRLVRTWKGATEHRCNLIDLFNKANMRERLEHAMAYISELGHVGGSGGRDPAGDLLLWQTTSLRDMGLRSFEAGYLEGVFWAVNHPDEAFLYRVARDHWEHTEPMANCPQCSISGAVER